MCDENRILNYDLRKIGTQREIEMMSMEPMNPNEIVHLFENHFALSRIYCILYNNEGEKKNVSKR